MNKVPTGAADIDLDLGNSLWKGMIQGRRNSAVVIPHAIRKVTAESFRQIARRYENGFQRGAKSVDVSMFGYNGEYAVVGENAETLGTDDRRSGGPKYAPDYYPFGMLALLLRLYPAGHENLRIMAAFPPSDARHVNQLINSLGGKHTVELVNGQKIVYKVRQVLVMDEPIGGIRCFTLAENGRNFRRKFIDPKALALCIDIGGKISNLVPFRADGWVDYDKARSVDLGIQDVMKSVSDILLATPEYAAHFEGFRGTVLPFDAAMRDCLRNGYYPAGAYDLPALDAIADATALIRSRVRDVYRQDLGGARPYRYVLVTGGGGAAMYTQLVEHVLDFPAERVYVAHDDPDQMHLANLFGIDNTLMAMLVEKRI